MPWIKKLKRYFSHLVSLLLILVITVALLAVIEGMLRLVYGKPDLQSLQYSPYVFNSAYQVGMKPNFTSFYQRSKENGGQKIELTINSKGFRGPEPRAKKDYRIMVYGDSNILGRFSDLEHTYVNQLRDLLRNHFVGKDFEVMNAGIGGAGTDQAVLRMEEELPVYKPDLVILQICASNDMGDMIRNRMFELKSDGLLVRTDYPVLPDKRLTEKKGLQAFIQNTQINFMATRINAKLSRKNNDPKKIMEGLLRSCDAENRVYAQHKAKKFSFFDDHYDIDVSIDPQSTSSLGKIKLMTALLGEAKAICLRNNVPMLVVIEPAVFDLCQNHLFGPRELAGYPDYRPDNLTTAIESGSLKNDLPTINLYPIFMQSNPKELYFKTSDDHWNDSGQKLAAKVTMDFILGNDLLIQRQ